MLNNNHTINEPSELNNQFNDYSSEDVNMSLASNNNNNNNHISNEPVQPMDTSSCIASNYNVIDYNNHSSNRILNKNYNNSTILANNDNPMSSFNNSNKPTTSTTVSSPTPIRSPAIQAKSIQINKQAALPGANKRPSHLRMNNE